MGGIREQGIFGYSGLYGRVTIEENNKPNFLAIDVGNDTFCKLPRTEAGGGDGDLFRGRLGFKTKRFCNGLMGGDHFLWTFLEYC